MVPIMLSDSRREPWAAESSGRGDMLVGSALADAFGGTGIPACGGTDIPVCLLLADYVRPREGQECPSTRPHVTGKNAYATQRHASAEADPTEIDSFPWRSSLASWRSI